MKAFLAHIKIIVIMSWRGFRYGGRVLLQWILETLPEKQRTHPVSEVHLGAEQAASDNPFRKGILKTEQIRTLEIMSQEVKILYTQLLALQVLADHQIDSREFSELNQRHKHHVETDSRSD